MNNKIWYPRNQALSQYLNNLDEIYFNEDNFSIWYV
jgi:spore coat protein CotF